ncbi:sodium/potassium/calcium exchanger 1-like isoform X1 [Salvia splendens]|uniref:sodium/potassium/calcium exchanger 1-like isoform X1 n=1 Tax=Salvia splendens TaxID=180675 RepID=UPI001C255BB3|nr:sodium/potassium/calcium exchanger 1-like isoform X1 [Salvia splendens]
MAFSEVKYAWQCSVNVANFVTVRPSSEGDDKTNEFKDWKEQMICLLESQDVMGFVNGEIVAPEKQEIEQYKLWRRTDRLVKGWILGSIGTDVLHQLRGSETARDVWLQLLENIFKQEEEEAEEEEGGGEAGQFSFSLQFPSFELNSDLLLGWRRGGEGEGEGGEEGEEGGGEEEEVEGEGRGGEAASSQEEEEDKACQSPQEEEQEEEEDKACQFSFCLQFPSFELNSDLLLGWLLNSDLLLGWLRGGRIGFVSKNSVNQITKWFIK